MGIVEKSPMVETWHFFSEASRVSSPRAQPFKPLCFA
jgi:hypothetical protein